MPTYWPLSWPLPGKDENIARFEACYRRVDRIAPVADLTRARGGSENFLAYFGRIFAARIIVGHNHVVGELDRNPAHQRALALVAVSQPQPNTKTELALEMRANRLENFSSESGVWSVIDENLGAPDWVNATFSIRPGAPPQMLERLEHFGGIFAEADGEPGSDQCVGGLE